MKHPLFACMGEAYPKHLEAQFERILLRIEQLWHSNTLNDYFSDLLIDKRGGRKGFPPEVLADIIHLREYHELENLRQAESREDALRQLALRGYALGRLDYLRALHAGDQEVVDLFMRASFNVQISDEEGTPAILVALKRGYTIVAQMLLKAGGNVNARDALGLTPLLVACGKSGQGYHTLAEQLVQRGAYINVHDRLGYTPLLLALAWGAEDTAIMLIESGADVWASTRKGESALTLARRTGKLRAVALLESKGAPLNVDGGEDTCWPPHETWWPAMQQQPAEPGKSNS